MRASVPSVHQFPNAAMTSRLMAQALHSHSGKTSFFAGCCFSVFGFTSTAHQTHFTATLFLLLFFVRVRGTREVEAKRFPIGLSLLCERSPIPMGHEVTTTWHDGNASRTDVRYRYGKEPRGHTGTARQ